MNSLKLIGKVPIYNSSQVKNSRIGIGFEKLDRDVFDPEKAYDKVAALGVKWVRLQSGWQRTEKQKGVYDFAWLDTIVDNLLRRGLQPWMCLCYGNRLYSEQAKEIFGAVGVPPVHTVEEKQAWHNYVAALTKHYAGKVQWFEVWNEPDGKHCWKHWEEPFSWVDSRNPQSNNKRYGAEYGEFVKATAAAAREGNPDAKIIGGCTCIQVMEWLCAMFNTGAGDVMNGLSYHAYDINDADRNRAQMLRALCRSYNPEIAIIQGETGAQSREGGSGALWQDCWTPAKQAKYLARKLTCDMLDDVKFASYFSCLDMIEALNGKVGDTASYLDYGYFGVLGADFDAQGKSTGEYTPKPSYYALQTIAAVFRGEFTVTDLPVRFFREEAPRMSYRRDDGCHELIYGGFRRANGSSAFVWWRPTELLTTDYCGSVSFSVGALPGEPRIVNLMTGEVYAVPEKTTTHPCDNVWNFHHLPCTDYPLMLTFGNFFDF